MNSHKTPEFNARCCGKGIRISYSIKDIRHEVLIHKTQLRKHGFPSIYNEVTQLHNLRFIQQLELFLLLFYLQQANLHSPTIMKLRQVRVMVFNATFNNISAISWWSVLLVKEHGVPGVNQRPVASHWQTLSHNAVSSIAHLNGFWTHNVGGDRHWLQR
jgi:hypothetical protein